MSLEIRTLLDGPWPLHHHPLSRALTDELFLLIVGTTMKVDDAPITVGLRLSSSHDLSFHAYRISVSPPIGRGRLSLC